MFQVSHERGGDGGQNRPLPPGVGDTCPIEDQYLRLRRRAHCPRPPAGWRATARAMWCLVARGTCVVGERLPPSAVCERSLPRGGVA